MHGNVLAQAFVYLLAAVVSVPIARRLGLGSVLGYLLAGVGLGPAVMGLVGQEGQDVMHFAEFGVVMMLFLVGLELRPSLLWRLRKPILGLGGLQVLATGAALAGVAMAAGLTFRMALAVGLTLSLSSTAIVLQSLGEKGLLKSEGGQGAFSVLLFQDIAVIPMLAAFPLLAAAVPGPVVDAAARGASPPGWQKALVVLGAVVGIVVAGRFLMRPVFRFLAETRLREIFTAAALTLVIGIALLMQAVGLSPALGTFVAGVVLAESEYRHQLESDIEPFKGLLLGVFFIAVGASIDFPLIASMPVTIAGMVVVLVVVKMLVLLALAVLFGLDRRSAFLLAFALAQGGEFAFVLVSFALQSGVFTGEVAGPVVAVVALSMLITPLLLMLFERVVIPRLAVPVTKRPHDAIEGHDGAVIIAGFGRFGQITGRMLRASGLSTTVLDEDPAMVDVLRRVGLEVYYGDASRLDLLHAAGCARARLFVVAVDDHDKAMEIIHTVRHNFPNLPLVARARGRTQFYAMRQAGVTTVVRETFASAVDAGEAALKALGFRAHQAKRLARAFRQQDEGAIEKLVALWGKDEKLYFAAAREALAESERLLRGEDTTVLHAAAGWDNEALRADLESRG